MAFFEFERIGRGEKCGLACVGLDFVVTLHNGRRHSGLSCGIPLGS